VHGIEKMVCVWALYPFSVLDSKAMTLVPQEDCETMILKDKTTFALPYRCGNPHAYGLAAERAG
jgi:hypothetical protein